MTTRPAAPIAARAVLRIVISTLALSTCRGADHVVSPGTELAIGTWGGDNAAAIVNDTLAHIHVGCTFGDIPGRVPLDANGRFTMDGSYVLRAFPVLVGPSLPAQFSGVVAGKTLTLAVAVNDTVNHQVVSLGPVTMVLGDDPRLGPCPVCASPTIDLRRSIRPLPRSRPASRGR